MLVNPKEMDFRPVDRGFRERGEKKFGRTSARDRDRRLSLRCQPPRQNAEDVRGARIGGVLRIGENAQVWRRRLAHDLSGSNPGTRANAALKAGSTPINASSSVINAVTAGSPKL